MRVLRSDLRPLSYHEYGGLLETLTDRVSSLRRDRGIRLDAVAPILRSGAFPGAHLASRLGIITMLPVQYKHTYRPECPVESRFALPSLEIELGAKPTILLADTNTVTGEVAARAAADLRTRWPHGELILATVMLDLSLQAIPGIDHLIWAQRTNERRTLSSEQLVRAGLSNDVFVFPWENPDEQWAEIQASETSVT
jgi:hypothetical protein